MKLKGLVEEWVCGSGQMPKINLKTFLLEPVPGLEQSGIQPGPSIYEYYYFLSPSFSGNVFVVKIIQSIP